MAKNTKFKSGGSSIAWRISLAVVVLLIGQVAVAQQSRSVGGGPSTSFTYNLPSERLGRNLGARFTSGSQFTTSAANTTYGNLLRASSFYTGLDSTARRTARIGRGGGLAKVLGLKVRSLDSLHFKNRARLVKLKEVGLRLAERLHRRDENAGEEFCTGFRPFVFPFGLRDKTKQFGYGFFCYLSLADGAIKDHKAYLDEFSNEAQQSIGEDRFLDTAEILVTGGQLPDQRSIANLYDPQLAALGNYLFNNRRYAKAAEAWAILAKRDPSSSLYKQAQALCLFASNDMVYAAPLVRQSLQSAAGWPDKGFFISGANLQDVFPNADDLAGSRKKLEALLEKRPDDANLNFLMAYIDLFHGNWPGAQKRLTALSKKGDNLAGVLLGLLNKNQVPTSLQRPTPQAVKKQLAQYTGLEEGPMTDAERSELLAALQEPKTHEDYMRRGDFRFFMGNYALAERAYRKATELKPEAPYSLFALAHARFATGEYCHAAKPLKQALALQPEWGLFEFRIQELYGSTEEYERHLLSLKRKVELRPQDLDSKFLLAYIHYFSGRYADTVDILVEILKNNSDYAEASYFLRLARLHE